MSSLPRRAGPRPHTTAAIPHRQLDQNAPDDLHHALATRIFAMEWVEERGSLVSMPGVRALWLCDGCATGGRDAFLIGWEFAHLHPPPDGSLHAALPPAVTQSAIEAGWAEPHPMARCGIVPATIVMLYGPRDSSELEIVHGLVVVSREFARGRVQHAGRGE